MVLLDHMPCEEGSGCLLQVPYPLKEQVDEMLIELMGDSRLRADVQAASATPRARKDRS